jgi:hypothetical protein
MLTTLSFAARKTRCTPARLPHSRKIALMQKKIFWTVFMLLGLLADVLLPFWWACAATIPILYAAWWIAYRSDWL